ncbi:MAG: YegS/Rv2252/BmrU family lipid kinase [Ruminococcaceae bacterium]|nr:YegS/Rv2252/BmrU family lipid kinase [Oscillospiraceae bacterium]
MKQLLLIINPTAGKKKGGKHLAEIVSIFNRAEYDVHVHITSCRSDATNAVKEFGEKADLFVCCGGDGTLNETVAGIIESGLDTPIGYIPAGSTNDFANALSLSTDVLKATEQIVSGTPTKYDVGRFGTRYFTYVASFGAFTRASYDTPQNIKNTLGHMAYVWTGIRELAHIKKEHLRITLDGKVFEDDYIFGAICNSTSVGGIINLKPDDVDMSDGKFEVLLIRSPKNMVEFGKVVVSVKKQKFDSELISLHSVSNITINANPEMAWSLDGEKCDGSEEIVIENLHKKIKIIH